MDGEVGGKIGWSKGLVRSYAIKGKLSISLRTLQINY